MKAIFVIGAGKGLGNAVARQFGHHDFKVVLMSRNLQNLKDYQAEFERDGIPAAIQPVDVTNEDEVRQAYHDAITHHGSPDVLFYNVGITTPDKDATIDAKALNNHYRADVSGAFAFIQQAMHDPAFIKKHGAILVTGGGLALHPSSAFLPLSMDKAALRAMVIALHDAYQTQGVYLGIVNVCGAIGGSEKYLPDNIAKNYWQLYDQRDEAEITY